MQIEDRRDLNAGSVRRIATVLALLVVVVGVAVLGAPAAAAAAPHPAAAPLRRSANFRLAASGGYTLYFAKEHGTLSIIATRTTPRDPVIDASGGIGAPAGVATSEAIYATPDPGGAIGTLAADLGPLGSVSVVFHPSGRRKVTRLGPEWRGEGCVAQRKIVRRLGTFEGSVVFHGEEGYTSAATTSVPGSVGTAIATRCIPVAEASPPLANTDSEAWLGTTGEEFAFDASRTARGTSFHALYYEQLTPTVGVARVASVLAPRAAFWFDPDGTRATVRPPAPFSGRGAFGSGAGAPSWRGDLAVEFPGVTRALTGQGLLAPRLQIYAAGRD